MNNSIKVCVCTFHAGFGDRGVSGVSTAPVYLYDQLKFYFDHIDLISLCDMKVTSPIAEIKCYSSPEILEEYDFVIFATPGITYEKYDPSNLGKYIDVLDHAKHFTFICNEENDRKLYPYHMNFLSHPNLSFITFNCPGMQDTFKDYMSTGNGDWDYVSFSPVLPPKDKILEKAVLKENKIISTCRWVTSKRIYEYLSMSQDFKDNGIEVYSAGVHQSYWYNLQMKEIPEDSYIDLGYFEPSQLPDILYDKKYHWNFLFQLRSLGNRTHKPRLEIATMEAIKEGCLPVVCTEFTPDWLGTDSAIRLSKNDYLSIPSVLGKLSDNERFYRLSKLYELVQENIMSHYMEYVNHIEKATLK